MKVNQLTLLITISYIIGLAVSPVIAISSSAALVFLVSGAAALYYFSRENGSGNAVMASIAAAALLFGFYRGAALVEYKYADINASLKNAVIVKFQGTAESVRAVYSKKFINSRINVSRIWNSKSSSFEKSHGTVFLNYAFEKGTAPAVFGEGETVEFMGEAEAPHKYKNPYICAMENPFKYPVSFKIKVKTDNLRVVSRPGFFMRRLYEARSFLDGAFENYFPADISGFLKAFFLGEQSALDDFTALDYMDSGMLHVLVVSGSHVTLAVVFISSLLGLLGASDKIKNCAVAIAISFYFYAIGLQAAIVRSYIAFLIAFTARSAGYDNLKYQALLSAFLIHITIFPEFLFSAGFALSYISTFMLIFSGEIKTNGFIMENAKVTILAIAGTYPLIAYKSGYFPLASVFSNLLTLWIYELLVFFVIVFIFFAAISVFLAKIAAPAVFFLALAAVKTNEFVSSFSRLNAAPYKMSFVEMLVLYALLAFIIAAVLKRTEVTDFKIAIAAAALFLIVVRSFVMYNMEGFEINFLDVGQGDCQLIRTPRGRWIMVDAGGNGNSYEKVIVPYLRYRRIARLEYLIITHGHYDHYAAALKMIEHGRIAVSKIILTASEASEPEYRLFLHKAAGRGIVSETIEAGSRIALDKVSLDCLWPEPAVLSAGKFSENDRSIVLSVTHCDRSVLLAGDITVKTEHEILKKFASHRFILLKSPHHGSRWSNSKEFIEGVSPRMVFVPSGAGNRFGHPHKEALERFKNAGVKVLNSQKTGGIIFGSDKSGARLIDWRLENLL